MGKEARKFSSSVNYAIGDMCLYEGVLYVFIAAHTAAAWNSSHVQKVDNNTGQEIAEILLVYNSMIAAVDFADTVVFEPSSDPIDGTRYKYILTNA